MRVLSLVDVKTAYYDYLLHTHKSLNKRGMLVDAVEQRVSNIFYIWNKLGSDKAGDRIVFWKYISGEMNVSEAHSLIKTYLIADGVPAYAHGEYCQMFDEFIEYIETEWGGINKVIDDEHIEVNEVIKHDIDQKLKSIRANDGKSFEYNYEVLNACFGANMHSSLRTATWDSKDGCLVWFPHKAKLENGRYIPGSTEVNWKNYYENNGEVIIQMLYPGETANDDGKEPIFRESVIPMHTFMKMGERDYRYAGTYMLDYKCSTPRYQVVRRIKNNIDLSIWAAGYDTDYFDSSEIGKDVFKNLYIEKNYKKHREYREKFLLDDSLLKAEEEKYEATRSIFSIGQFSIVALTKMSEKQYVCEYIPTIVETVNELFDTTYTIDELANIFGSRQEYGMALAELLYNTEKSVNDRIHDSIFGNELAAQLYTLHDKDGDTYIYTLPIKQIDEILYALGIVVDKDENLVSKQSKIYFWKYCDEVILNWSPYRFYQFLCFMINSKKRDIQYISKAKPDVVKRIQNENKAIEEDVDKDALTNVPAYFEYGNDPRLREINVNAKPSQGCIIPRHTDRKINALIRANYCCEFDNEHPTFKRRNSDKNYTETHHLIPLEYSAQFRYTLDTEENIVSLCSNCHNQIHYGAGAEELLKKLFEERQEALMNAGLDKTETGIEVDLKQLLHMYGID